MRIHFLASMSQLHATSAISHAMQDDVISVNHIIREGLSVLEIDAADDASTCMKVCSAVVWLEQAS